MEKFVKERRFVGRVEKFLKDSRKSSRMLNTSKYIEFYVCWTFRFIEEIKRFFEKRNHRSESLLRTNIFIEEPNTFTKETIPPRWKVSIETSKNIKFFFEFISCLNLSWKKKNQQRTRTTFDLKFLHRWRKKSINKRSFIKKIVDERSTTRQASRIVDYRGCMFRSVTIS